MAKLSKTTKKETVKNTSSAKAVTTPKAEPAKTETPEVELPDFKKATKDQLVAFISVNIPEVFKDESLKTLQDTIMYVNKQLKTDARKVTKADLITLSKEVCKSLNWNVITEANKVPIFSSSAASLKAKPKTQPKSEEVEEETPKDTTPKKTTKKPLKAAPKKAEEPTFPDTLEFEEQEYVLSGVQDIQELAKKAEGGATFLFAFWWTKTLIKQFDYSGSTMLPAPKEFENNLDIVTPMYISDSFKVFYGLSMYTEALYQVMPDDFQVYDNGFRYSAGIEYQIYELAE